MCACFPRKKSEPFRRKLAVVVAVLSILLLLAICPSSAAPPKSPDAKGESVATPVDFINQQIRQSWEDNEVSPSKVAEDVEWLRRVYLDLVGHIPPYDEVRRFVDDRDKSKRATQIDRLLDDPAYVRNWTTIWTNLCIGRQTPRRVSRTGMRKFFREAFNKNRPWNDIVHDIITAEGHFEKNGAVNFLLAQMTLRDDGVQATAKTTRLFLGIQVQCTQCHSHPFNDWKQNQFWEFNSFFRQVRRKDNRRYDPKTGRMVDDYSELLLREFSGPVYFEKRNGLMQVAYPRFFDSPVDPGLDTNRRQKFAKLISQGEKPLIASAIVNRMWGHFFGFGFTNPLDDMGKHNSPSHPELLDSLSKEFVRHNYDLKKLFRWITNSDAYQLTSKSHPGNTDDDPASGTMPLFSRMYVKSMEAEQLYDSLIIATEAHRSGQSNWSKAEKKREQWMRQFIIAFGTDENDESTTFNGTIPQSLMMMNGQLVASAISTERGSLLGNLLVEKGSDAKKVRRLFLTTLGRKPTRSEMKKLNGLLRASGTREENFQDLLWALLNSNEFIFNH